MKTLKKWLLRASMLVLPAFFAGTLALGTAEPMAQESVIANAVFDEQNKDIENDYYHLVTTDDSLTILFNGRIAGYKNITRKEIKQFVKDAYHGFKEVVVKQLGGLFIGNSLVPKFNLNNGIETYEGVNAMNYVVESNLKYEGELDYFMAKAYYEDYTGDFSLTQRYFIDRYTTKYLTEHPETTEVKVVNDVANIMINYIQPLMDEAYSKDGKVAPSIAEKINADAAATIGNTITLAVPQITSVLNVITPAVNDSTVTVAQYFNTFMLEPMKLEFERTILYGSATQVAGLFKNSQSPIVAEFFKVIEFTNDAMVHIIRKLGDTMIMDIVNQIGLENFQLIVKSIKNYDPTVLKDEFANALSTKGLIKSMKSLSVNGNVIMKDKTFQKRGVVDFIKSLPKPSVIETWSDENMKLTFKIELETTIGVSRFDFTIGFFGDCHNIRSICHYLAKMFTVKLIDGVIYVDFDGPAAIANMYEWLCTDDTLSDHLKHAMFDYMFSSVEEITEKVRNFTIQDVMRVLKEVDYESALATLLSAEALNEILGITKITDGVIKAVINDFMKLVNLGANVSYERIKSFVNKFIDVDKYDLSSVERVYNKVQEVLIKINNKHINYDLLLKFLDPGEEAYTNETFYRNIDKFSQYENSYNKALKFISRLFDKIPEKLRDKTILSAYEGNSFFHYDGNIPLNFKGLFSLLPKGVADLVNKIYDQLFNQIPAKLRVNLNATIKNVYSVTYQFDEVTTKKGLLPVGADIPFFANAEKFNGMAISYWVDENDNPITEMPARDVVVRPIYDETITISDDIDKVYDGTGTLKVTVLIPGTYAYQWYKDGQLIPGETSDTIDVSSVADSGTYFCEANDGVALLLKSPTATVNIMPVEITAPEAGQTSYVYTGEPINYVLATSADYTISGDVVATNAGQYAATVSLNDPINYVWGDTLDSDDKTYPWEITKATVVKPTAGQNLVYTGLEQTYYVTDSVDVDKYYVTGNTGTDAGEYTANIYLNDPNNYMWYETSTSDSFKIEWRIYESKIPKPDPDTNIYVYNSEVQYTTLVSNEFYTVTGETSAINAGVHHVTVTPNPNYCWEDGTFDPLDYTWEILRKPIAQPDPDCNVYIYNGEMQYTTIQTCDGWVVEGENCAINAGVHYIKVTPDSNHTWEDGSLTTLTYDWTMLKKRIQFPPQDEGHVYNGEEQNTTVVSTDEYTVTGETTGTNAGYYDITISLNDPLNNQWIDLTTDDLQYVWKIDGVVVAKPDQEPNHVYNGETQEVSIESNEWYTVTGDTSGKNAGTYTITITLNNENFEWEDGTFEPLTYTWVIDKAEVTKPVVSGSTTFTYDGDEKSINITTNDKYTIEGDSATDAGEYVATVSLKDPMNYKWVGTDSSDDITFNWVINKAKVAKPEPDTTSRTYNGNAQYTTITSNEFYMVEGQTASTNAGTFTVRVVLRDADNYEWEGEGNSEPLTYTWTINKAKVIAPTVTKDTFTYNGSEQSIEIKDSEDKSKYTISGELTATNAGEYGVLVSINDTTNYEWATGGTKDIEFHWVINKKVIVKPAEDTETRVYNGETQSTTIVSTNDYTVGGDTTGVDAGTYTVTVTLKDTLNTVWDDDTIDTLSYTWTINKKVINMDEYDIEWSYTKPFEYDGNAKTIILVGVPEGAEVYYDGNTATEPGFYTANAIVTMDPTNYEVIGTTTFKQFWRINPAESKITHFESVNQTPTGKPVVVVDAQKGVDADYKMMVELFINEELDKLDWSSLGLEGDVVKTLVNGYDIYFIDGQGNVVHLNIDEQGHIIDPSQSFTVKIEISSDVKEEDYQYLRVVLINEDGTVTDMDAKVDGEYLVFTTAHFSKYAVVKITPAAPVASGLSGGAIAGIVIGSIVVVGGLIFLIIFLRKKKKDDKEETK